MCIIGKISKYGRFYSGVYDLDLWLHLRPEFPAEIDAVPQQDFKEIYYPPLNLKETYKWDYVNNKTIVTRFELLNDKWKERHRRFYPRQPKTRNLARMEEQ